MQVRDAALGVAGVAEPADVLPGLDPHAVLDARRERRLGPAEVVVLARLSFERWMYMYSRVLLRRYIIRPPRPETCVRTTPSSTATTGVLRGASRSLPWWEPCGRGSPKSSS